MEADRETLGALLRESRRDLGARGRQFGSFGGSAARAPRGRRAPIASRHVRKSARVKKVRPGVEARAARAGTTETERTRRRRTAWRTVDPSQFGRRKPSTLRARAWAARQRDWRGAQSSRLRFRKLFGHDVRFCFRVFFLWPSSVRPGTKSPKRSDQISDAMLTRPRGRFFIDRATRGRLII